VRRAAFPVQGVIRNHEKGTDRLAVVVRAGGCVSRAGRGAQPGAVERQGGHPHCGTARQAGPTGEPARWRLPWWRTHRLKGEQPIAHWAPILQPPPEPEIADSNIRDEVRSCLALASWTRAAVASGERLAAARAAVDLVKAYDRVLDNIQLVPLSPPEQQRVRDRLTPVTELLRKYRLR
jgi:hypothetical protein